MPFLKKEWKTLVVAVWLVVITVLLVNVTNELGQLQKRNAKMASTLDSVESVALSTDAGVSQTVQRVSDIDANINFIVQKVRRR